MSERFYTNCALAPGPIELDGPEAHHLAVVCRIRPGDVVCLFNGDGADYLATVIEVAKKRVGLNITDRFAINREIPFPLEVAAPLPKGDRTQFLIEKLTELGVTSFTPLVCQRSAIHPKESTLEKLRRYVIEASKQCGRNVLMRIESTTAWPEYALLRHNDLRLLAHPGIEGRAADPSVPFATSVANGTDGSAARPSMEIGHMAPAMNCRGVVGPEGGFTSTEIELARANRWRVVDLGPRILRIETAAIALAIQAISKRV